MAKIDLTFHRLCDRILTDGKVYENKNRGVKRLQIPSFTFRHSLDEGFPAITNKDLYWKGIVTELLWFLRGDNDIEYLNRHGVTIWNKDAYNWYKKHLGPNEQPMSFEEFSKIGKGSVGRNYSTQWRDYRGMINVAPEEQEPLVRSFSVDQIKDLIRGMMNDIMSSRLKVNAWNPAEVNETALPPCHSEFQIIGVPLGDGEFGFELHWNQRSVDTFLGLPFNIASYALLAHIIEFITGYKAMAIEGTLKCVHFYDNQYDAVRELLKRDPDKHSRCELEMLAVKNPFKDIPVDLDDFLQKMEPMHFKLSGYTHDDPIKVEMLAPKNL